MKWSEISYRYASAIYAAAGEQETRLGILKSLQQIEDAIFTDRNLLKFIRSPLVKAGNKEKALSVALSAAQAPELIKNFLLLLAKKNRLELLPEIVAACQSKEDAIKKIRRGFVKSAENLSEKQKSEIQSRLAKAVGSSVELSFDIDKNLIGGVTAQIGSLRWDDALSSHLNNIKEDLTRRIN